MKSRGSYAAGWSFVVGEVLAISADFWAVSRGDYKPLLSILERGAVYFEQVLVLEFDLGEMEL